jgi:hypothetical protein
MLSYASDFWPLFWTVLGGGLVLTALVSLLVGTLSPDGLRSRREPAPAWAKLAADFRAERDYQARRGTKAA